MIEGHTFLNLAENLGKKILANPKKGKRRKRKERKGGNFFQQSVKDVQEIMNVN